MVETFTEPEMDTQPQEAVEFWDPLSETGTITTKRDASNNIVSLTYTPTNGKPTEYVATSFGKGFLTDAQAQLIVDVLDNPNFNSSSNIAKRAEQLNISINYLQILASNQITMIKRK